MPTALPHAVHHQRPGTAVLPLDETACLPTRARTLLFLAFTAVSTACAAHTGPRTDVPAPPAIIAHAEWEARPPSGHAADANRRNLRAGDSLQFRDLVITVIATDVDSLSAEPPADVARLRLRRGGARDERAVREGAAFNWQGFHLAVVAIYSPGELGGGLVVIEVGTVASLPPEVASSDTAGGAAMRLRVPHRITHVTLHHTGSSEPLRPEDDPAEKLRGLQSWGASDRNWWDVPYHYLIDLEGDIYEGRDWHYMGETNTTYDPSGHFLISVIGNYGGRKRRRHNSRRSRTSWRGQSLASMCRWTALAGITTTPARAARANI